MTIVATVAASAVFRSAATWAFQRSAADELHSSEATPKSYSDVRDSLRRSGSDEEIVQSVVDGLASDVIHDIHLGDPPKEIPRTGRWMYASVADVASSDEAWMLPFWEANLAQGAIADQLADAPGENLANVISGATATFEDEAHTPLPSDAGDVAAGQVFSAQGGKWTDEEIEARIQRALEPFGLEASTIRVLRPLGPAVEIVATINNQKLVTGQFDSILRAIQQDANYEGSYLELRDVSGAVVAVSASAYRTGGGGVWFEPGYDAVLDIGYGGSIPVPE